jgi:hypothetical protein
VGIPECFQTEYCLKNAAYWRNSFQLVESFIYDDKIEKFLIPKKSKLSNNLLQ